MQYKLEISNLTKRFGEKTLFEALDLTVTGPAILWAPSGWGKTTLLRILMGLEVPTSGTVTGVGKVGAVFQEDRLCPQLNAIQNVELVLPEGKTKYREQIHNDFLQIGLDEAALSLPARKLSGGQKRRAALLRALWAESDTLLLAPAGYPAAGRAVHRHGPRHHEKSRSAAEGALRRKGRSAGHPRSGGHSGAGVAGDGIITILPGCCFARSARRGSAQGCGRRRTHSRS